MPKLNPPPGDDPNRAARLADLTHLDRLGPLSREVVAESPVDIWVGRMIADAPMHLFNPNSGAIDDAGFARWLQSQIRQKMGGRGPWEPLVPTGHQRLSGRRDRREPPARTAQSPEGRRS